MNTFLERLKAEKSELEEKLTKLTSFIANPENKTVTGEDQWVLLKYQRMLMKGYSDTLAQRIRLIEK
jgi:hypothetical protein